MRNEGWDKLQRVAVRQYGLVSRAQARTLGFTRMRLRSAVERGQLERVHDGVFRFAGNRDTWEQRALAATLLLGSRSALSHRSAGLLFRLDGIPWSHGAPIELTAPRTVRATPAPGLLIHRSRAPLRPTHRRGIPVVPLARTLVDLASLLPDEPLELALDSAQRDNPLLADELTQLLDDLPTGTGGVTRLRALLAERDGLVTDSPLEARVARALRLAGVPRPQPQLDVFDAAGHVTRLDFAWPTERVALHVEGYAWHRQRERFERDHAQRSRLTALGWHSVWVTARALRGPGWLTPLREALAAHAPQRSLDLEPAGPATAAR